jgi:hypothetical protein
MAKKEWYTVVARCIEENSIHDCKVGDTIILAKVKSLGNAYTVAVALSETYGEYFTISYK